MRSIPSTPLIVVCLALTLVPHTRAAQDDHSSSKVPPVVKGLDPTKRQIIVDGAEHPELISDEQIITMLISRLWVLPPNADAASERRFRNLTARMKLSDTDYAIMRRELQRAYPALSARQSDVAAARNGASFATAHEAITASAGEVYGRLLEFLSADGRRKLRAHIADAKKRVRISRVDEQ